jgi:outer membrane protein assembly factor BamB
MRRTIVSGLAVILQLVLICSPTQAAKAAVPYRSPAREPHFQIIRDDGSQGDWPQFGYDAAHDSYNPHESLLNVSNVSQLQEAWSFRTVTPTSPTPINFAGNVVEANGIVYATSQNGTLFALDASTGNKLWTFDAGTGYSVPAVDGGRLFTVCQTAGGSQGICALDAGTGSLQWSYAVPGATTHPETPPVVANNLVIFGACGSACAFIALSENKGQLAWSQSQPAGCPVNNGVVPAVWQNTVYATTAPDCTNSEVLGLDAQTGAQVLLFSLSNSGLIQGMAVANSVICIILFADGGDNVYTMPTTGGFLYWRTSGLGSRPGILAPALAYSKAYIEDADGLLAFTVPRGRRIFSSSGNQPSAAVANGVLYTSVEGVALAIDARGGSNLWAPANTRSAGWPIVAGGVVYGSCAPTTICAWTLPSRLKPTHA